jgi:uncharacterized protein (TIRG00374 family)
VIRARPRRGRLRSALTSRLFGPAVSLAVVVAVFAFALPRLAGYSAAWDQVRQMTVPELVVLVLVALVNLSSYAWMWMAVLPGLAFWRAVMVEEASTAVANTVPVGFAFGLGTIATMLHSCGRGAAEITRAVVLTGLWNNLVKLGAPLLALGALALVGEASGALRTASLFGLLVLAAAVAVLALALVRPRTAHLLGQAAERVAGAVARFRHRSPPTGWAERAEAFRTDSEDLLRRRWAHLTLAALASHTLLFSVLLTCVWFVDDLPADVTWAHVVAVFAVTRLITLVPITPGALGVAELSYVAGLVAVGVPGPAAAGAVLLFRALTWLLAIPVGGVCLVLWRRGVDRRLGRQDTPLPAAPP